MLTITRGHLSHLSDICSQLQVSRFPHQGSAHTAGDLGQLSIFREYTRTNFKFTFVLVVVLVLEFKSFCYFSFDHWHDTSRNGIYIRSEELFNLSNPPKFFQQIFACQALLIYKAGFMSENITVQLRDQSLFIARGWEDLGLDKVTLSLSEVMAYYAISTLMTPSFNAHSSFMIKLLQCKPSSLV